MPPRRSYKKSIAGCCTYKQRRVKCDELRPICSNCTRRGTSCTFPIHATNSLRATTLPNSSIGKNGQLHDPATLHEDPTLQSPLSSTPEYEASQLLKMRLIHHCTMMVSATIIPTNDDAIGYIWSTEIFQLAFQSGPLNPLLDILLGVSAYHLRILEPGNISVASAASSFLTEAYDGATKCSPK